MGSILKRMVKYRAVSIACGISALFVISGWLWAHLALRGLDHPLIIHYASGRGIDATGSVGNLAQIGVLGIVIVLVNFALALELETRDRFLGKLVAAGALFFSILIFIAFAAIISVN